MRQCELREYGKMKQMELAITNVTKSYGKNRALSGFTATLEPGIYALLGPNGSGKSTLMNILTDNLTADEGVITFSENGETRDVRKMGVEFRERLGYMPQYPGLYPNFTVEQFLLYMAALKGMKKEDAKRQIPELLRAVELDDIPRRRIGALSGGMKQRLTLAQAVLGEPSVLVLDEPTAGLDPKQRIAVRNFISKIAFDKIILIATHVVSDIEFIARSIIMLKKGVIVDNAPPYELTKKINGHVWVVPCTENDVALMQERCRVTNISRDEESGEVLLRVLADSASALPEGAHTVTPTLEDYYLHVFGDEGSVKV